MVHGQTGVPPCVLEPVHRGQGKQARNGNNGPVPDMHPERAGALDIPQDSNGERDTDEGHRRHIRQGYPAGRHGEKADNSGLRWIPKFGNLIGEYQTHQKPVDAPPYVHNSQKEDHGTLRIRKCHGLRRRSEVTDIVVDNISGRHGSQQCQGKEASALGPGSGLLVTDCPLVKRFYGHCVVHLGLATHANCK